MQRRLALTIAGALLAGSMLAGPAGAQEKKTLALVTNASADFWTIARRGVEKAATELPNYKTEMYVVSEATAAEQRRILDDLLTKGIAGVSISSIDPANSTEILNRVASQAVLFTTDSDAPNSKRIAYIGSSNTDAGKQAGQLMVKALPNGGKCMGFVGLPGADNARERIEGVKETIKGSKIELVDVRADDIDQTRAKRNVEDTITARPEINCMVGFYSYNTPRIYEALKDAGKIGKVTIIGFDEDPITLGGVKDGTIVGTVVQQPYEWGYQGMKDLAKYLEGDKSFIPANKLIIVPTKIIDKSNVDAFWTELKDRQGKK